MPTARRSRAPEVDRWSADDAWQEAELRDLNEAVDRLALERPKGRKKGVGGPKPALVNVRRILVGVDGSDAGDQAVGWAIGLAKLFKARVWVLAVLGPVSRYETYARQAGWKMPKDEMLRMEQENGERIVEATLREIHGAKVPAEGKVVRGWPVDEICKAVDRNDIDLVVMGSHGHRGRDRVFLGSVADGVKNATTANVLIVKDEYRPGDILAPIDGSDSSRLAAYFALRLSRLWSTRASLLHVFEVPWLGWPEFGEAEFRGIIEKFDLPSRPRGVRYQLDYGRPAVKVVERAKTERAALVVMGSRGLGGLRGLFAGSVSNRVSHEAPASVLLVKRIGR